MDTDKTMPADDARIKRVLRRYLKGEEFPESTIDLTGISFVELQSMCSCDAGGFKVPRELDGYALVCFTNRMGISFDASRYDYFVHAYVRREFCSSQRVPPVGLDVPCEDGPPTKIPLPKGTRWVSSRPKEGLENFIAVEEEYFDGKT